MRQVLKCVDFGEKGVTLKALAAFIECSLCLRHSSQGSKPWSHGRCRDIYIHKQINPVISLSWKLWFLFGILNDSGQEYSQGRF